MIAVHMMAVVGAWEVVCRRMVWDGLGLVVDAECCGWVVVMPPVAGMW